MKPYRLSLFDVGFWLLIATAVGFAIAVLISAVMLIGCAEDVVPSGGESVCLRYAKTFGAKECGVVYQFPIPAQTPSGYIEFCIPGRDGLLEQAEDLYGPSKPSPRFDKYTQGLYKPPCAYQCPSKEGCNAYVDSTRNPDLGGCFCP
jgi:hypothetical protein